MVPIDKNESFVDYLTKKGVSAPTNRESKIFHHQLQGPQPLSFGQKRMWFLQQLSPYSPAYNTPSAARIKGPLNISVLRKVFIELMGRHHSLLVSIRMVQGELKQVLSTPDDLLFVVDELDSNGSPLDDAIQDAVNELGSQPFDLSTGPLFSVRVLRIKDTDHVLLLNFHHIICDGWSKGMLIKEMSLLYEAFLDNLSYPLPSLPINYFDFVQWQTERMNHGAFDLQLKYWRTQLKEGFPVLELPFDYQRPPVQSNRGSFQLFNISQQTYKKIKLFIQTEKVTLFMFLIAVFKILLHRYSGQQDILVGTPVAGRNRSELEKIIGLFVNTLVLRSTVFSNYSVKDFLKQVRKTTLEAYENQDVPFEKIVEEINPTRSISHNPFFSVMLQVDNAAMPLDFAKLELTPLQINSGMSQVDLSMTFWEEDDGLMGSLEYNTDLFKPETIERIIAHYETLLRAVLSNPNRKISSLPLITEKEKKEILFYWNNTSFPLSKNDSIISLFEEKAHKRPDHIAVIHLNKDITYRELNERANQIAHILQNKGIGKNCFVPIYLEKSIELVVAIIGVLKAGAAYVPIAPSSPIERVMLQIKELHSKTMISKKKYLVTDIMDIDTTVLCLDRDKEMINSQDRRVPNRSVRFDDLACLIYTSGSTDIPKGVLIEHHSILNLTTSFIQSYNVNHNDRMLPITSVGSASLVGEVLPILAAGGSLFLTEKNLFLDLDELVSLIDLYDVTILSTIPSLISRLNTNQRKPKNLRLLLSGGETLFIDQINQFSDSVQIVNGYGLSESTVCSTCKTYDTTIDSSDLIVSIGKPIINTKIYVLDDELNLLPVGVKGEIYISGEGIVRGYLNNDKLTTERFINNPYNTNQRLFKTGDLACWLPNGELRFFGRSDEQVQINGFRVELKEIEKHLRLYPHIDDVVVTLKEDSLGERRLSAFYTNSQQVVYSTEQLREWLSNRLPQYMIPSHFILMNELPVNTNGKIDVRALPSITSKRPSLGTPYEQPQTDTEKIISLIWEESLNIKGLGIDDNFFDLGGHSLLLIDIYNRLKNQYKGMEITIVDLFKYTTIRSLARFVSDEHEHAKLSFDAIYVKASKQRAILNKRSYKA